MRNEQEFLVDVARRLNAAGVDYMLTGSMASNYWGIPRTTHDLDFVVVLRLEDVDRFAAAFESGFFIQRESVRAAITPPHQFNVLDEQSALKADFWLLREKAFELEMFRRRQQLELFGVATWIATPEDVLLHKLYWDQLNPSGRQLSDAAGIFQVQGESLDLDYIQRWSAQLGVSEQVKDLVTGKLRPKHT